MSALCVLHLPVQVQAVSSGTLAQKATILICICEARGLFTGRVTDYTQDFSWFIYFGVEKGPAAKATDAPQP